MADRAASRTTPARGAIPSRPDLPLPHLVGQRVRQLRAANGWRQEDLARRLEVAGLAHWTSTTIANLERGGRTVTLEEALALARVFDAPLDSLLPDVDQDERLGVATGGAFGGIPLTAARWYLSGGARGDRSGDFLQGDLKDLGSGAGSVGDLLLDLLLERADATRKAARALHVAPAQVEDLARQLWGVSLGRKREWVLDEQIAERTDAMSPRSLQALRGHVTRQLLAEMRAALQEKQA